MDIRGELNLLSAMSQPEEKLATPVSVIVDLILVAIFFTFMYGVLKSHVPSNDPHMIRLWGALGTACLTGGFWLALQMFRIVLKNQRRERRGK